MEDESLDGEPTGEENDEQRKDRAPELHRFQRKGPPRILVRLERPSQPDVQEGDNADHDERGDRARDAGQEPLEVVAGGSLVDFPGLTTFADLAIVAAVRANDRVFAP